MSDRTGIVVIGRNEADRLGSCLRSLLGAGAPLVYVDSGSSDGSVELARRLGVEVHELDPARPFSAARARNEGVAWLAARHPQLAWAQLVDGDCEIEPGWIERGVAALEADPRTAVVCGRLRERDPEASIYQRVCDVEWDGPTGEVEETGGIFLVRLEAFREVDGFDERCTAGEEPDLCARLRGRSWTIRRIRAAMATHDAGLTHFGGWWTRAVRSGYAYAGACRREGLRSGRRGARPMASVLFWAGVLPAAALGLAPPTGGASLLLLLLGYGVLWSRIAAATRRRGRSPSDSRAYATFVVIGKFAQLVGVARGLWEWASRRPAEVIEVERRSGAS